MNPWKTIRRMTPAAIVATVIFALPLTIACPSAFAQDIEATQDDAVAEIQATGTPDEQSTDQQPTQEMGTETAAEVPQTGDTDDMPDTSTVLENPKHMWNQQNNTEDGTNSDTSQPRSRMRAQAGTQWTTSNGVKTFLHGNGEVFASPAASVIDVSEWQGDIDWNKVKQSGVDGVILRLGFCNNLDIRFERNLQEVRRLNIPYGIYLFSYADNAKWATIEANFVAQQMQRYGLNDMTYPVFYDLEQWNAWNWSDGKHTAPTTPAQYNTVVNAFTSTMANNGHRNIQIYSYLHYFRTALNDPNILSLAGWVAQYNTRCDYDFPYYTGTHKWQYTSSGTVNGISGNVDMNAFGLDAASSGGSGSTVVDGVTIPSNDYTGWITQNNNTYWFDSGRMAKNKEVCVSGSWYWFDANGAMAHGVRWLNSSGGKWVYYHISSGKMQYGEQYLNYDREHTGWYYFEPGTGKMAHGTIQVNGTTVYYDRITGQR